MFSRLFILGFAVLTATLGIQETSSPDYRQSLLTIQEHIRNADLAGALALLEAAERKYPAQGGLENLRGVIEAQRGHVYAARDAFQSALHRSPKLIPAYLNLARLDLEASPRNATRTQEALHLYETALRWDPLNTEAHVEAASILTSEGKFAAALRHLAAVRGDAIDDLQVQTLLCADEAVAGQAADATQAAAHMEASPDLTEAEVFLVEPALRLARRADLLDSLLAQVARRTDLSVAALRLQGLAEEAEGKPEQARTTLEQAYARDPASVDVLTDLARIALAEKQFQEALGYLAHARALAQRDAALSYEFGVVCYRMNLLGEAQKAVGEALDVAPRNPEYLLAMSTLTVLSQDPMQAKPYLARYHEVRPQDPKGVLLTGAMYFTSKDFDHAQHWLAEAAAQPSTAATALLYLGSLLRQKGDYEEALADLQASDRLRPEQAETHAEIGQIYLQLKRYDVAGSELQRAVALDPDSYGGNFGLLQLYARTGDRRRVDQAKRFEGVKSRRDRELQQAMRVIQIEPIGGLFAAQ